MIRQNPEPLYVGRPNIGCRETLQRRLDDIIDRRWLTNGGRYVGEFEERIRDMLGVKHCVAMSSGTAALQVAARAMGLQGEVIVPAFTFIATAHALSWIGLRPVFCDVDRSTHNLDPEGIAAYITPATTAILGTHLWGRPCDTEGLQQVARRHGLRLFFDAAHAFGCGHRNRMLGNFGDCEVLSFHATKVVTTGEGGAVVTNDDNLASEARLMRNFGFAGTDNVVALGTNAKMSEIHAALGLSSLDVYGQIVDANRRNYQAYRALLKDVPGIHLVQHDETQRQNYQYVVLEVDEREAEIGRDDLMKALWSENVFARRYFYPGCHRSEPYRTQLRGQRVFPATEILAEKVLVLPTGTSVGVSDVADVCEIIKKAIGGKG